MEGYLCRISYASRAQCRCRECFWAYPYDNPTIQIISTPPPDSPAPVPQLYDISLEPTPEQILAYEAEHGFDYSHYEAPIDSPHLYTYSGEETDIDKIARILGEMHIEDMKQGREGQSFTITKVHEFSSHVYSEEEVTEWLTSPIMLMNEIIIGDNQWIVDYGCRFDYTGHFSLIGSQLPGLYGTMLTDGSGEYYHWMIQKTDETIYHMRPLYGFRSTAAVALAYSSSEIETVINSENLF
jgi:hypothetical protein